MKNPFVYGEIVPLEAFADRVIELDRLVTDLAEGQKVFLISPRRYGKSSLVRQALAQLQRKRILTLEVTVSSFSSYVAFLEGYARALLALETKAEKARGWLRELFPGSRPDVRLEAGPSGAALAVSFPAVRTPRDASQVASNSICCSPSRRCSVAWRSSRPTVRRFNAAARSHVSWARRCTS